MLGGGSETVGNVVPFRGPAEAFRLGAGPAKTPELALGQRQVQVVDLGGFHGAVVTKHTQAALEGIPQREGENMVGCKGLEPLASSMSRKRSNQLS